MRGSFFRKTCPKLLPLISFVRSKSLKHDGNFPVEERYAFNVHVYLVCWVWATSELQSSLGEHFLALARSCAGMSFLAGGRRQVWGSSKASS